MRKLAGVMVMMVSCAATTETTASTEKPSYFVDGAVRTVTDFNILFITAF